MPVLAAFLIYFREGIEAALLVGALLAGVRRLGRSDASRYVHAGWIAALPAGARHLVALGPVIALGADQRELMEAVVALLRGGGAVLGQLLADLAARSRATGSAT